MAHLVEALVAATVCDCVLRPDLYALQSTYGLMKDLMLIVDSKKLSLEQVGAYLDRATNIPIPLELFEQDNAPSLQPKKKGGKKWKCSASVDRDGLMGI